MNGLPMGQRKGDTAPKETHLVTYRAIKNPRICQLKQMRGSVIHL